LIISLRKKQAFNFHSNHQITLRNYFLIDY